MTWTATQKALAARACQAAGIDDDHRRLLLRQFRNSLVHGEPTSTSPKLNQSDFEQFMAHVESFAGGQICLRDGDGRVTREFSRGYWGNKASDDLQRVRFTARRTVELVTSRGIITPDGVKAWISSRVSNGRSDSIEELNGQELHALINGMRALAMRHGTPLTALQQSPLGMESGHGAQLIN